jgi:hypothetical protein
MTPLRFEWFYRGPALNWFNLDHHDLQYEIDSGMLPSTLPYLLKSQRQVLNHIFARHPHIERQISHIRWIVDNDPLSINDSLAHLQYVHSLEWVYVRDLRGTPKPDYDSDSDEVGVAVGASKTEFFGVGVGVPKTEFFGVGVSHSKKNFEVKSESKL